MGERKNVYLGAGQSRHYSRGCTLFDLNDISVRPLPHQAAAVRQRRHRGESSGSCRACPPQGGRGPAAARGSSAHSPAHGQAMTAAATAARGERDGAPCHRRRLDGWPRGSARGPPRRGRRWRGSRPAPPHLPPPAPQMSPRLRRAGRGRGGGVGTVRHAGRHCKGAGRGKDERAAVPGAAGRRPRVHAGGGRALTWEAPPRRPRTRRLRAWEE